MATLRLVNGFETGDLLQGSGSGSPSVQATTKRTGEYALQIDAAATPSHYVYTYTSETDTSPQVTDNYWLHGFAVRFADLTYSADPGQFFAFSSTNSVNAHYSLALEADGDLIVRNDNGTTIQTITAPFTVDEWMYIEVECFMSTTVGTLEVFLDGVSQGIQTSLDTDDGNNAQYGRLQGQDSDSGGGTVYFDDFYAFSDASAIPSALGPQSVYGYASGNTGTAAHAGLTTSDDTLGSGDWDNASVTPITSGSDTVDYRYTASGADGAIDFTDTKTQTLGPGPTGGDYTIAETINGACWFWYGKRGNGGGSAHHMWVGNDADTPITQSADMVLTGNQLRRAYLSQAAGEVPTSSESFAMGGETTGARDIWVSGAFAFLLADTPAAAPTVNVTGVVAEADAAVVVPTIVSVGTKAITGLVAEADAAAVAGTIVAQVQTAVTGLVAEADAAVVAATIATVRIAAITGVVAEADAAITLPTIVSVQNVVVVGVVAEANAEAVIGTIEAITQTSVTVIGVVAEANAVAVIGTIVSIGIVVVVGVVAEADASAVVGAVLIAIVIVGVVAEAQAEAVVGTIVSIGVVAIVGVVAEANAGATIPTIVALVTVTVVGVVAEANAAAVIGSVLIAATIIGVVAEADADAFLSGWLDLPGTTGSFASTPDSAALSITGDLDIRVRLASDDWTAQRAITGKWALASDFSYYIRTEVDGTVTLRWSTNGTSGNGLSVALPAFTDGDDVHWIRVNFDVDNGSGDAEMELFTARDQQGEPSEWTSQGTALHGSTTSIFDSAADYFVGEVDDVITYAGKIFRVITRDGIDGTVVFDADFDKPAAGDTTFVEDSAQTATVTMNGSSAIEDAVETTRIVAVSGVVAEANAEAIIGTITTTGPVLITGVVAEANAEVVIPTVTAVVIVTATITGVVAEANAEAVIGTVVVAVVVVGVVAEANAGVTIAVIAAISPAYTIVMVLDANSSVAMSLGSSRTVAPTLDAQRTVAATLDATRNVDAELDANQSVAMTLDGSP